MKFLSGILVCSVLFLSVLGARSVEEIRKSGSIKIGFFDINNTYLADDEILKTTFDYEKLFAARLARNLSLAPEFVPIDTDERIKVLENDLVDVVIARFTITKQRASRVDFALPYMKTELGMLALKDSNMTKIDDYKGKKVIVVKTSISEEFLREFYPEIELVLTSTVKESFDALESGKGDAFSSDTVHLHAIANVFKQYAVFVEDLGEMEDIAPAVKKGNTELLALINQEMNRLKKENFFKNHFEMTLRDIFGKSFNEKNVVY